MDLKLSPLSVLQLLVFGDKNTRSAQLSMEIVNLTPFTVIHMEMWTYWHLILTLHRVVLFSLGETETLNTIFTATRHWLWKTCFMKK